MTARLARAAGWLLASVVLGYLALYPLVTGWMLARHLWGPGPSPLDPDDVEATALILVVGGAFVAGGIAATGPGLRWWRSPVYWPLTAAVLALPPVVWWVATERLDPIVTVLRLFR